MKILFLILYFTFSNFLSAQEEFNSVVTIEIQRREKTFTCSGFFISDQKVLTSAHCLDGEISGVRVFPQEIYSPYNYFLKVKDFHIHPEYNPELSNFHADIGMMNLESPFENHLKIAPINCKKQIHGNYSRIGFGRRNHQNKKIILSLDLKRHHPKNTFIEFYENDSQSGDSGGPIFLVDNNEISLLAIHSTLSFGPLGKYSFNPNICSFKNWIEKN